MPSWIVVLAVLIVLVAAVIFGLIRDRKKGKCSCGHNCGACAGCAKCSAVHGNCKKQS